MFSDNYSISDKYSLTTMEKISTVSRMPWRYTYLYDKTYLPQLSESVVDKLNLLFNFKYMLFGEVLQDSSKYVVIEEDDSGIKLFELKTRINYASVGLNLTRWNHFVSSLGCEELHYCKNKIDKLTDVTDIEMTKIESILYDADANFVGVSLFDSSYNLSKYETNKTLLTINNMVKRSSNSIRGITTVFPHNDGISYKLIFNYVKGYVRNKNDFLEEVDYTEMMRESYIDHLLNINLLTEEQSEFIRETCVGLTQFDLEYIVNDSGDIEEVFFNHHRIKEFKDLTTA